MNPIHALHPSIRGKLRKPANMDSIVLPIDLHTAATEVALSVFADVVNTGRPLQDALLAVYMTGLNHGQEQAEL